MKAIKRAYIRDDVAEMVESYQKSLGLSSFSEAVNSLLFVNLQGQKPTDQSITQQPGKTSAIDDLDGLF
jgi:hypothetical protein